MARIGTNIMDQLLDIPNKVKAAALVYVVNLVVMLRNFRLEKGFYGKKAPVFVITKAHLVPILAYMYIVSVKSSSNHFLGFMASCWIGDLLLLSRVFPIMASGQIAFIAAHVFMALHIDNECHVFSHIINFDMNPIFYAISAIPFVYLIVFLVPSILRSPRINWASLPYVITLASSAAISFLRCAILGFETMSILVVVGFAFFVISDKILISHEVQYNIAAMNFNVLLTYGVGMLLIVLGFLPLPDSR